MTGIRCEPPPIRDDGLQVAEHRGFQERFSILERWGWGLFAAVVALALLGLTGAGGPFARAEAALGAASIEYPRVSRWQATEIISFAFPAGATEHVVTLGPEFGAVFRVDSIQPEFDSAEAADGGQRLVFAGDGGAARVTMHVSPRRPGLIRFAAAADGAPPRPVAILVLP